METTMTESEQVIVESVSSSQVLPMDDDTSSFLVTFGQVQQQLEDIGKEVKNVNNELKNLRKKYLKIVKSLTKNKKRKPVDSTEESAPKKEPSGFISPIALSRELTEFLNVPEDIMLPRTVVTKQIIAFIKENGLESTTNGRNFDLTDSTNENAVKLRKLFNIENGNEVTYFNLQSFLKPHFITASKKSVDTHVDVEPTVENVAAEFVGVDDSSDSRVVSKKIRVRRPNKL